MGNFHFLGTGCCGFLRVYDMFKNHHPILYKGGKRKYQNGFQLWDSSSGLIWDSHTLSKSERMRRVSLTDRVSNITHSYLPYVEEFIEMDPSVKFICLKGNKSHSIRSLFTCWGYNNPCYVSNRSLGIGNNRYPVDQFPNLSDKKDELEATEYFWELYYSISEGLKKKFPENFFIVDSPRFFSDSEYQEKIKDIIGVKIPFYYSPVDFESFDISTTLHGGLGNNLFQISEVLSFCRKYDLPNPFFGTWDLVNSDKFPPFYNCDRFLGGHEGNPRDMLKTFPNLDWRENLNATFDVKFMINDMFNFGRYQNYTEIVDSLGIKPLIKKGTASLHFRFCTLPADDHKKDEVKDEFYDVVFSSIPADVEIFVFSDNDERSRGRIGHFQEKYNRKFTHFSGDTFETLIEMASCEYHILHISTFSFWGAFLGSLDPFKEGHKVFCPRSFVEAHGENMINPRLGWNII